jgi:dynein assembly factor with WDR repeat domains 1
MCGTASIDNTCRVWDVGTGKCMAVLKGHSDEILDFNFNAIGTSIVTASVDTTIRLYSVSNFECTGVLKGH